MIIREHRIQRGKTSLRGLRRFPNISAGISAESSMPKSKEFISSESESDSDSEAEPKPKKKKTEKKKEKKEKKEEKSSGSPQKKSSGATKGENGEYMFQLARMRFATVSEFRGKVMVGIREFYEKDGQMLPGRKGISLSMDQWKSLKDQMGDIEDAIKEIS